MAVKTETTVVRSIAWYVIRDVNSVLDLYCGVIQCSPSSSASGAWISFLSVYGETKNYWKKKGMSAKRVECQWSFHRKAAVAK